MNEIQIHDIKEIVEIPDISLYIYMILWILGVILILAFIYFIYKFFYNKSKDKRKSYYKILKNIDLNNSKLAAYNITKYARLLANNEREKKLVQELNEELSKYKYKKNVEQLSDDVKIIFERFMDNIDV